MVLLASRQGIFIVDILYTKHFVWNALPEERAAGCRQSVGAAWHSLEQLLAGYPSRRRVFAPIDLGS